MYAVIRNKILAVLNHYFKRACCLVCLEFPTTLYEFLKKIKKVKTILKENL